MSWVKVSSRHFGWDFSYKELRIWGDKWDSRTFNVSGNIAIGLNVVNVVCNLKFTCKVNNVLHWFFTDVFHWVCLDKWSRSLPANTAPAGYTCPTCQECIFPQDKLVSPVADALRKILSDVNWARPGLGLPLLEERVERKPHFSDIPAGPRPAPEGESMTSLGGMTDGRPMGLTIKKDTLIQVRDHS